MTITASLPNFIRRKAAAFAFETTEGNLFTFARLEQRVVSQKAIGQKRKEKKCAKKRDRWCRSKAVIYR